MKKRFLSLLLCLSMILGNDSTVLLAGEAAPGPSPEEKEAQEWKEEVDEELAGYLSGLLAEETSSDLSMTDPFEAPMAEEERAEGSSLSGTGTTNNPYQINGKSDFLYFRNHPGEFSNKHVKLFANIDLSGTELSAISQNSGAYFDGGSCVIKNISLHAGVHEGTGSSYNSLLGYLKELKNLTVQDMTITADIPSGKSLTVYGVCDGISKSLENVDLKGTVQVICTGTQGDSSRNLTFAGIAGYANTIESCENSASTTITGDGGDLNVSASGIAGSLTKDGWIQNCHLSGSLISKPNAILSGIIRGASYAGVIVAHCSVKEGGLVACEKGTAVGIVNYVDSKGGIVTGCTNKGTVRGKTACGILCTLRNSDISGCINEGTVEGETCYGILYESYSYVDPYSFVNCENKGMVEASDYSPGKACGLFGMLNYSMGNGSEYTFDNNRNTGTVRGYAAFGLGEHVYNDTVVSNCYNTGTVEGEGRAAGLLDMLGTWVNNTDEAEGKIAVLDHCYNSGTVTADEQGASGLVANLTSQGKITDCYNIGSITGNPASGIAYYMGLDNAWDAPMILRSYNLGFVTSPKEGAAGIVMDLCCGLVDSCYNTGHIRSTSQYSEELGGIAGGVEGSVPPCSYSKVSNCFNAGVIEMTSGVAYSDFGGIAGYLSTGGNGGQVTIDKCYNIGEIRGGNGEGRSIAGEVSASDAVGNQEGHVNLTDCYYLSSGPEPYYASSYNLHPSRFTLSVHALSEQQMLSQGSFPAFDFTSVWKMGSRKYRYPLISGVGEEELIYNYGGIGADTVFTNYMLHIIDQDTKKSVPEAAVTLRGKAYIADKNGYINLLIADPSLGTVKVQHKNYHDKEFENVMVQSGTPLYLEIEKVVEVNPPDVNMGGTGQLEGGDFETKNEETGQKETVKAVDLPFVSSIKLEPKWNRGEMKDGKQPIGKIPISVEYDHKEHTCKIAWGYAKGNTTSVPYDHVKDIIGNIKKLKNDKDAFKELEKKADKPKGKFGVEVSVYYLGYIKIKIINGQAFPIEHQALLGISGKGSLQYRPAFTGGICYGKLAVELTAAGALTVKFIPEENRAYMDTTLIFTQTIALGVGVGTDNVHLEVGAEGKFTETLLMFGPDKKFKIRDDLTVVMDAEPYLELKAWIFSAKIKPTLWKGAQLYPDAHLLSPAVSEPAALAEAADHMEYELLDRDYIRGREVGAPLKVQDSIEPASGGVYSLSPTGGGNGYVNNDVSLVRLSDGTEIAAWTDDDGTKNEYNRTTVYYAVGRDGSFGEVKAVKETERMDSDPVLYAKGDMAYLLYENADTVFDSSGANPDNVAKHMDLYLSVFDAAAGTFGEPVQVTDGRRKKALFTRLAGDGSKVIVCWTENENNALFMSSGKNTVYSRTWSGGSLSDIVKLSESEHAVLDLDFGYADSDSVLVYTADTDGDLSTKDDEELFRVINGGATERLTNDSASDHCVFLAGNELYFAKDGLIMKMTAVGAEEGVSTGVGTYENFRILSGSAGKAILFFNKENFASVPMISYEKSGTYTAPVRLSSLGSVGVNYFGALYDENGVTLLCSERAADPNYEYAENNPSPYDSSAYLRYHKALKSENISLDPVLYADQSKVKPEAGIEFSAVVKNETDREISSLKLILKEQDTVKAEKNISVSIPAGAEADVVFPYTLPSVITRKTYTLTASVPDLEEPVLTDNSASMTLGLGNLKLDNPQITRLNDGSAVVTASLRNTGYDTMSGIQIRLDKNVSVSENPECRENIGVQSLPSSLLGGQVPVSIDIPKESIHFAGAGDENTFTLSVSGNEPEISETDNDAVLSLDPVAPTGLTMNQTSLSLNAGDYFDLSPEIVPADAYDECLYCSSDSDVAYVSDTGRVLALSAGKAVITVMTALGGLTKTVEVTVREDPDADAAYYFEYRGLSLERGDTEKLLLQWEALSDNAVKNTTVQFESSDESILLPESVPLSSEESEDAANVSKVKLTAKKEGSAVLSAKIGGGAYSAFCIVNITDSRVKYASFAQSSLNLTIGQSTSLSVNAAPDAPLSDFVFTSLSANIVSVNAAGVVTALSSGTTEVTALYRHTEEGESPVLASCSITVYDPKDRSHSLSFDTNGGSEIEEELVYQVKLYGEAFDFPSDPVRTGYDFMGWNTDPEGTGASYSTDRSYVAGQDIVDELELYAVWKKPIDEEEIHPADITEQVYTGKAIKPKLTVYDGDRLLIEGTDYTVRYKNNKNAGRKTDEKKKRPTAILTGKGNYSGTCELYFDIFPANIEGNAGLIADDLFAAPKKGRVKLQKPVPVVLFNEKRLVNKRDFTVSYNELDEGKAGAFEEPGTYTVAVNGKGNYTGTRLISFTITDKPLLNTAAVRGVKAKPYTGEEIRQDFTVKLRGNELAENTGFSVRYEHNTEVGKAYLILRGIGDYSGIKRIAFNITGQKLAGGTVTGIPSSVVYDGTLITVSSNAWIQSGGSEPVLSVTSAGVKKTLVKDVDFRLTYENNRNKGTAKVVFEGINGYRGTIKKTFRILPFDIGENKGNAVSVSLPSSEPYTKGGARPGLSVSFGSVPLLSGRDYSLVYKNNNGLNDASQEKTAPKVIITGRGNFKGSKTLTFAIVKQELSELSLYAEDRQYKNRAGNIAAKFIITDRNGKKLQQIRDYDKNVTLTYKNDVTLENDNTLHPAGSRVSEKDIAPAGTEILITVSGNGCYQGSISDVYRIIRYDLSKARVIVDPMEYSGKQLTPSVNNIQVTHNGDGVHGEGDGYQNPGYRIAGYGDNIKKGKGTVILEGIGDYGGRKTASFRIKTRSVSFLKQLQQSLQHLFER